jgi:hypothetical protein
VIPEVGKVDFLILLVYFKNHHLPFENKSFFSSSTSAAFSVN